jgi:hypothetical protein
LWRQRSDSATKSPLWRLAQKQVGHQAGKDELAGVEDAYHLPAQI